jgi:uncharacterized protein YciW
MVDAALASMNSSRSQIFPESQRPAIARVCELFRVETLANAYVINLQPSMEMESAC